MQDAQTGYQNVKTFCSIIQLKISTYNYFDGPIKLF